MSEKERFLTPFRKCMYPFLQQPQKSEGYRDTFKIVLKLNGRDQEDAALLKKISELHKEAGGQQKPGDKGHPVKFGVEVVTENDAGDKLKEPEIIRIPDEYWVTFKRYADYCDHIPCYDTKNNELWKENNFVANDSLVRVAWSYSFYSTGGNKGVFLSLDGVQIKDLKEWMGYSADDLGFTETDGYVTGDNAEKVFGDDGGIPEEPVPNDKAGQEAGPIQEDDDLPF